MKPSLPAWAARAALGFTTLLLAPLAQAGAVTDGSTGAVQTLGGRFTVPQALGRVQGANLFHSFTRFGIEPGEVATFTTQDPGLRQVIARVTGDQASVLQGRLQLQAAGGGQPDFWLLNPNGIVVGAGASFDVPGGLHLGAAQTLRFADGSQWNADTATGSRFTTAAPEAFGFLGPAAGTLAVHDADMQPVFGAGLTLAGGRVQIERARLATLAAPLRLQAQDALVLGEQADVSASGLGSGAPLQATAAQLSGSGGALLAAWNYGEATGSGLQVDVSGALGLTEGASLLSWTVGAGMAGPLAVNAGRLTLSGSGAQGPTSIMTMGRTGAPGALSVRVADALQLTQGASIGSSSRHTAEPGAVSVQAGSIALDGQGLATTISALSSGDGAAAAVDVRAAGSIKLRDGGQIFGATLGAVDAGRVSVQALQIEMQGGTQAVTGVYANALGAGRGGALALTADTLTLRQGARISTSTNQPQGSAGYIAIDAGQLTIDGAGAGTGIDSFAYGSQGNAGSVDLQVRGELLLLRGGLVAAGTLGSGSPGAIRVHADKLLIDGSDSGPYMTGIAGDALRVGAGAAVEVQATQVTLRNGGTIATSTASARDGQPLLVAATQQLLIDGGHSADTATGVFADTQGSGNAGSVTLRAAELAVVDEGMVSTSTLADGRGGALLVQADRVRLAGAGGLVSVAAGSGDAGRIDVLARESVVLAEGGHIVTNSGGAGAAGEIHIQSASFVASGRNGAQGGRSRIASRALPASSGQAGRIQIVAEGAVELGPDALLSIGNDALEVTPGQGAQALIRIQAAQITLQGAEITAAASAAADAGTIELASSGSIGLTDAGLHTSAASGQGGPIRIVAERAVLLRDSLVTTSVLEHDGGDGGNIDITAQALALASGFVQANTSAAQARGGRVTIDTGVLVPDGSHVFVGGNRIADFRPGAPGFNVIQAAAPDGLAGRLDVTRPELNLAGSLAALLVQPLDFGLLRADICTAGTGSSFTVLGRGGLAEPASAPLRSR